MGSVWGGIWGWVMRGKVSVRGGIDRPIFCIIHVHKSPPSPPITLDTPRNARDGNEKLGGKWRRRATSLGLK